MTGHVHSTPNCCQVGSSEGKGASVCAPLRGNAKGAAIEVKVDLDAHSLSFKVRALKLRRPHCTRRSWCLRSPQVNDGEHVDAGVKISATHLRPWALMCFPGDKIRLEP